MWSVTAVLDSTGLEDCDGRSNGSPRGHWTQDVSAVKAENNRICMLICHCHSMSCNPPVPLTRRP